MIPPLFVSEATLSLYPADGGGNPVTGSPYWVGRAAENLILEASRPVVLFQQTGAATASIRPVGPDTHSIAIDALWLLDGDLKEHRFPTGPLVLVIEWQADAAGQTVVHRRTYRGVRETGYNIGSQGVHEIMSAIRLQAESMDPQS